MNLARSSVPHARRRFALVALAASTWLVPAAALTLAAPPASGPATQPSAPADAGIDGGAWQSGNRPAGATRPPEEIGAEIEKVGREVYANQPEMDALFDPAKRAAIAPKALPPMRKMVPLLEEFAAAKPELQSGLGRTRCELLGMMAMLGDADALQRLKAMTVSPTREEKVVSQAWVFAVRWAAAIQSPQEQQKVLAEFTTLARSNIDEPEVAQAASLMTERAATPALLEQAEDVILKTLDGAAARKIGEDLEHRRKLRAVDGKPLAVDGKTVAGQAFSTAGWKGKVVLVDFWATWCPPCMAGLPELEKAYAQYHDKGLEIVGVSSDRDADNFRAFLGDNKNVAWPQLFSPDTKDLHPLAEKLGVATLPTMFIIDRKGVVRSVSAQENYKDLIPKLLAEKGE